MCGIAGVVFDRDAESARAAVVAMNTRQRHRGPHHASAAAAGRGSIGNTRLAIMGPRAGANQPFRSSSGRASIVFNGEIYNYRDLARSEGLTLQDGCDGEVLPQLWERYGTDMFPMLRGMFAVAVFDAAENRLTLARDGFGMKPLWFRRLPSGALEFASELLALPRRADESVDRHAVWHFLAYGHVGRDQSPVTGVAPVLPGTLVVADETSLEVTSFAAPDDGPSDLAVAFRESVRLHRTADVPVALLLSSGVDSTAVASAAAEAGHELTCVTLRSEGGADETADAAMSARHYGFRHESLDARLDEVALRRFFAAMQRPTIDGINTFVTSFALQRFGFTVALTGTGGDEVLAGYPAHRHMHHLLPRLHQARRALRIAAPVAAPVLSRLRPGLSAEKIGMLLRDPPAGAVSAVRLERRLFSPAALARLAPQLPAGRPPEERAGEFSMEAIRVAERTHYLEGMLLPDADAFSMAASLELRMPFVDPLVWSAAGAAARGAGSFRGKQLLVDAMGDAWLKSISTRPKRGFLPPMRGLMTSPTAAWVWADAQRGEHLAEFVSIAEARALLSSARDVPQRMWAKVWALLVLEQWLRQLVERPAATS